MRTMKEKTEMRFMCHIVKRIRIAALPVAAIAAMAALSGIAAPSKADSAAAARRTRRPVTPEIAKSDLPKPAHRLMIFLLMGQSNMAGRGELDASNALPVNDRILMLDENDRWRVAAEPLHADKPVAGAGLGASFAAEMIAPAPVQKIGLVPCAVGGTSIEKWMPGAPLYSNAVRRARLAMESGRLAGIIWHQGEADSDSEEPARAYGGRFRRMVEQLRADLGQGNVRVVAGELGRFLARRAAAGKKGCAFAGIVNEQLHEAAAALPNCYVASSEGLTDKGDLLHFDTPSLRTLGERYAERMMVGECGTVTHLASPVRAFVGGRELKVCAARHSAYPFNQVWPGYQRPIEQTKVDWFVSFDTPGPCELTLETPGAAAFGVRTRPLGVPRSVRIEGDRATVSVRGPEQFVVEFPGGGPTVHVFANPPFERPAAPDALYFGPGEHDVGLIAPTNGQTVVIDDGAVVYGSIYIYGAKDVKVTGRGIVDASRERRGDRKSASQRYVASLGLDADSQSRANCCLMVDACTNVTVEGIVLRDSPRWTATVRGHSRGIVIDNIKIIGQWRYNSDGIDICSSEDVVLRNSFIRAFDDCIVARATLSRRDRGPLRNILAENCVTWCDWAHNFVVAQGSPSLVENIVFRDSSAVEVNMQTCFAVVHPPRGAVMRNIEFSNIESDFVKPRWSPRNQKSVADEFPYVEQTKGYVAWVVAKSSKEPVAPEERCRIENVRIDGLSVYGDETNLIARVIEPSAGNCVFENIVVTNLPPSIEFEYKRAEK